MNTNRSPVLASTLYEQLDGSSRWSYETSPDYEVKALQAVGVESLNPM